MANDRDAREKKRRVSDKKGKARFRTRRVGEGNPHNYKGKHKFKRFGKGQ